MNFVHVLVIAVAILTILAALALVFGSTKSYKLHSLWFLAAAVGGVIWAVSVTTFLSLGNGQFDASIAPCLVKGIYIGVILMDVSILGYVSWKYKFGKILTSLFLLTGIVLSAIFLYDPSILYSEITLTGAPSLNIDISRGYYIIYGVYLCLLILAFCGFLIYRIKHTTNKKSKKGYGFFLYGLIIAGALAIIFDLILPPFRYVLIWAGPLAVGLIILGFYFSILNFKMVTLKANWLKIMSLIVIVGGVFIVYFLIFHLVFFALFKVSNPSYQVVLLNFIMIAVVLSLMPALSEIINLTRSLVTTKQIDVAYIVKKLSSVNPKRPKLKEVSAFLSEHMHFSYVAFLVNDRLYSVEDCKIPADFLEKITKLSAPAHGAWQDLSKLDQNVLEDCEISRVALLTGANGEMVGQMIFGKPTVKATLEHKDLVQITMITSLMGTIIEDGRRKS